MLLVMPPLVPLALGMLLVLLFWMLLALVMLLVLPGVMLMILMVLPVVILVSGVFRLDLFRLGPPLSPGRLRRCRRRLWPVAVSVYRPRCCWPR